MRLINRFRFSGLLILLVLLPFSALADLKVTFLSAQGAALLQADGQTMLWEPGPQTDADKLLGDLSGLKIEKIDLLALPSVSEDSSAEIGAVLGKYVPATLLVPGGESSPSLTEGISPVTPGQGAQYDLGSAKVTVLDAATLTLRVTYGDRSFLLVQDAAQPQGGGIKADVLAADGAIPQALVDAASPLLVIGGGAAAAPAVLQTGEGAIVITTDGTAIQAEFTASGVTSQPSVNMRKEASQKAGKAATLTKGTVLNILGAEISKEELWYKAEADGKTGYIRGDLVAFVSQEEAETLLAQATPKPKKSSGGSKPKPPADDGSNPFSNVGSGDEDPAPCH